MTGPSRAALIVVVLLATGLAARSHAAKDQSVTLTAGLGTTYDNNILEYSDAQLNDFESGAHADRYSLESRDDLVLSPSLGLGWELDSGGGRRHALRLRGEGDFHDRNGTADMRSVSAGWRESFHREGRFALGYYGIPHYYVRQLFAEDVIPAFSGLSRYRRAEFGLHVASASWSQRVARGTQLAGEYQFERRDYTRDFDERDSNLHQGQLTLGWTRLPRRSSVSLLGAWRSSTARAKDSDEQPGVTPDDVDVSYTGYSLGGNGQMELGRRGRWRWGGDLGYVFESRHYGSDRPADRYHNGRRDSRHTVELGLRAAYRPHGSVRGFYRLEDQTASLGSSAAPGADTGSYRSNQAGLVVEWSVTHRFRAAGAEERDAE